MKRLSKCSYTVAIILLFFIFFSIVANATSESCVEDSFSKLVAYKLTEDGEYTYNGNNIPPNDTGSCGYVAMSMLLMFYDTYWHENFVPDALEYRQAIYNYYDEAVTSSFSGIAESNAWRDFPKGSTEEQLNTDFYNFVQENSEEFLQPHLIQIGISKYPIFYSIQENWFGTYDYIIVGVLEEYLYEERGFSKDQVEVHLQTGSIEELSVTMTQQIENGNPVLYMGKANDSSEDSLSDTAGQKSGHVLVAYGIDESEDIMLHLGWNTTDPFTTLSTTDYIYNTSIVWIEIKDLNHVCSNNYLDFYMGEDRCSCQIYGSTHPAHGDNHLLVERFNENKHWQECNCGYKTNIEYHSLSYTNLDENNHERACVDCGYEEEVSHTAETSVSISASEHQATCYCGHVFTESHTKGYCEYNSLANHNIYCNCGEFLGREVHTPVSKLGKTYCSGCLCNLSGSGPGLVNGGKDDPDSILE